MILKLFKIKDIIYSLFHLHILLFWKIPYP